MVLLKIESEQTNKLKPLNMETLKTKLAAWYIHKAPSRGRTRAHLEKTEIELSYYERLQQDSTPQEWRFWEKNTQINKNDYGGATHDNNNLT